jgi:hypothetical protein
MYRKLTYQEAITGPDKDKWKAAIEDEKESLILNSAWKEVDAAEAKNKKILSNKWVSTTKYDGHWTIQSKTCGQKLYARTRD